MIVLVLAGVLLAAFIGGAAPSLVVAWKARRAHLRRWEEKWSDEALKRRGLW